MNKWLMGAAFAVAACGAGDDVVVVPEAWPEVRLDVRRIDGYGIAIAVTEVDHPDRCSPRSFLASGCDQTSDVIQCDQAGVAPWIARMDLVRDDVHVASVSWDRFGSSSGVYFEPSLYSARDDLGLAIYTTDVQRYDVRIPDLVVPAPTIDAVTWNGAAVHVAWTAAPPSESGLLSISNGFGGRRCHVAASAALDFAWDAEQQPPPSAPPATLQVIGFARPSVDTNALGSVVLWNGRGVTAEVPR